MEVEAYYDLIVLLEDKCELINLQIDIIKNLTDENLRLKNILQVEECND